MKIQPIDADESVPVKTVVKSRLKRLFEWQFKDRLCGGGENGADFEPNSVCLAKMVQNFIEESNDKHSVAMKCSRNHRCNCFNGNCDDSSDDESFFCGCSGDFIKAGSSASDTCDVLKGLVGCVSNAERVLLADTMKITERNKMFNCKRKDDSRKNLVEGLVAIGYVASICKSRWEKTASYPSGEYEYIDVIIDGERVLIDIDFKSEFEIARSTGNYRSILQTLPSIFVGQADRLQKIVWIIADAAKQSLKKKGMPVPPWRRAEYMRAKWLSPYTRTSMNSEEPIPPVIKSQIKTNNFSGEFELIFKEKPLKSHESQLGSQEKSVQEEKITVVVTPWEPPAIKPKSTEKRTKIVAGLASILKDKS
ncbi:hypothetical protein ACHQM5_027401 [Ranunculus cassubicifolius]